MGQAAKTTAKPSDEQPVEGVPEGAEAAVLEQAREQGAAIVAETRAAAEEVLRQAQATAAAMIAEATTAAREAAQAAAAEAGAQQGVTTADLAELVKGIAASQDEKLAAAGKQKEATVKRAGDVEEGFEPVVFRSKGINFTVVRVPRHRWTATNGEAQMTDGVRYEFAEGRGDLIVRNSEVAEYLRGRPTFNREFWEVGKEPHAAPDPSAVLDRIMEATLDMDSGKLRELAEAERASNKRPVILNAIKSALDRIERAEKEAG